MTLFVDAGALERHGPSGAVWSLPRGGDLDANVVVLQPGHAVDEHVNDEVDVLIVVVAGEGRVVVDGTSRDVAAGVVAHVPRGAARAMDATGVEPFVYVTVHRARSGLGIGPRRS